MWEARDHAYGGAKHRYKENRGRLVRMLDPFTFSPVEFKCTVRADNWLLRNFCPRVKKCTAQPGFLQIFERGKLQVVPCDLVTTFNDGVRIADLVVSRRAAEADSQWMAFQKAATVYGLVPKRRFCEEVRANLTLLDNLDFMRQHLVEHPCSNYAVQDVWTSIRLGARTPAEVISGICRQRNTEESIASAIFRLYRSGEVSINITGEYYGKSSKLAPARRD